MRLKKKKIEHKIEQYQLIGLAYLPDFQLIIFLTFSCFFFFFIFVFLYISAAKRHVLVKQDSVISFADQRRGYLTKQDSVIAYPTSYRNGETHHVSILKKTNSQNSSSPHKSIEFVY